MKYLLLLLLFMFVTITADPGIGNPEKPPHLGPSKSFVGCSCGGEEKPTVAEFCKPDAGCHPCGLWVCDPSLKDCEQRDSGIPCDPQYGYTIKL